MEPRWDFKQKQKHTLHFTKCFQVGNYVEQFDLAGNYQGEWPGWYNWPDEMVAHSKIILMQSALNLKFKLSKVMGPGGELVVSALGAMDDQHMLAPGLVTYRSPFFNTKF